MRRNPKQKESPARRGPPRERKLPEETQLRLPNQAAPVRRTENPPGPFRLQNAREAICDILSPYAAAQCRAASGLL